MRNYFCLFAALSLALLSCEQNNKPMEKLPLNEAPEWSKSAIWYQIFVERFYNGDANNNPTPNNMEEPFLKNFAPKNWEITPWTSDWYALDEWADSNNFDFRNSIYHRRYGGDLAGVIQKLDYLQELGINAIYFNPLNDAPSLHKYDARNFHHIDIHFGPDPEGDKAIIASENPLDPNTWKWTSADLQFLELVKLAKQKGIRVIMDYSWNHTGTTFWAWQDIVENQQNSRFKDWYEIETFADDSNDSSVFSYKGWIGIMSLPELKKVDITTERIVGKPYEGNIHPEVKQHIYDVSKRWLAPNDDVSAGIDGFRLDVADHIGLGFWRDYRKFVRNINPETYLVGEIWWETWPDDLMNPQPYLKGDVFDAVMFYQVYRPARYFFAKNDYEIDAPTFRDSLLFQWNRIGMEKIPAMMNVASSHDSPRLLTSFYNPNKYKFQSSPSDDNLYKTNKPDEETFKRLRLYLAHTFTIPGAPHIWNGEEMGMWGADDPHCRKPLMWPEFAFEAERIENFQEGTNTHEVVSFNREHFEYYQKLIKIRNENPVLNSSNIEFLVAEGKVLSYTRKDAETEIMIIFNAGDDPYTFQIPEESIWTNLLDDSQISSDYRANPLSCAVLKRSI